MNRPPLRFVVRPMIGDPGGEPWSPNSLAELRRLSELKPEPVETVTSTTYREDGKTPWCQAMNHAEDLLARYSEALDEIDAMNGQNPFSAFAADPLSLRVKALLAEMREEGARIRKERGR